MSDGDDGAPKRPASAKMPAAPPRPKPPVPGLAPPRPGTPGRANPPPLPPRTAAAGTPPPPREARPSVEADPSGGVDEGWLTPEDAAEASLAPPAPAPPPSPSPSPPSNPSPLSNPFLPVTLPSTSNPFLPIAPPSTSNPFLAVAPPSTIASPSPIAEVERTEPVPVARGDAEPARPRSAGEPEATPASSPLRKRSRAKVLAFVLLPALVLVGGGFFYQAQENARSQKLERAAAQSAADATGRVEPPPLLTAEPAPPATYTAEPPPSASAPKRPAAEAGAAGPAAAVSADPSKTGILDTTALPAGRRIVVDGRVVGTSPRRVVVGCGVHRIQIGDLPPETLQLPCGGEISFTD